MQCIVTTDCVAELCLTSTYWDNFNEIRTKFWTLISTVAPLIKFNIMVLPLSNSTEGQTLKSISLEENVILFYWNPKIYSHINKHGSKQTEWNAFQTEWNEIRQDMRTVY